MTEKQPGELDPDRHRLPESLSRKVSYDTADRSTYRLSVDFDTWPAFRPIYERLARELPGLGYAALDDTVQFGSNDRELERRAARLLGVMPLAVARDDEASAPDERSSGRGPGRPTNRRNNRYPFDQLVRVGDSFLVQGTLSYAERAGLSAVCGQKTKQSKEDTGVSRRYVSHQVPGGVAVFLAWADNHSYSRVVKLGGR